MRKISLGYSVKNIPHSQPNLFKRKLIETTEKFIKNMRWRAFFYLNPEAKAESKETYGFKSRRTPPTIPEMKEFESKMTDMIQNVELGKHKPKSDFQQQLKSDAKSLTRDSEVIVQADKTTNYYKLKKDEYQKLIEKNIHKDYKKTDQDAVKKVVQAEKTIANNIELEDRIEMIAKKEPFVTLKDHKDNFSNNPTCRLINPAKTEIGKVSKQIIDRIVKKTAECNNVNLWKKTTDVTSWFKNIPNKDKATFINFDIVEFYPSISEELLTKAIEFSEKFQVITELEKQIIMQAKRSLLFSGDKSWSKKSTTELFDVTMGSFDGAETCELVVVYILSQLKKISPDIGLYRDDGLAFSTESPQTVEKMKKKICKVFKENKLRVTIEANKKIVNFLDATLDLKNNAYYPYMKKGNVPIYVNTKSNHPPYVLSAIPKGVNKRLSSISSNDDVFKKATPPYQEALEKSGFEYTLKYENQENKSKTKCRKRNVTWYNPPYDSNVTTNVGKKFLEIVDKCFPKGSKLNKIFNRNTVKISYSCMPNMKNIIEAHNVKITTTENKENEPRNMPCNCRQKDSCPMNGDCRQTSVVYQAVVKEDNGKEESYVGITEGHFKTRWNSHKCSFKKEKLEYSTELSKHIWKLKRDNKNFNISWRILKKAKAYTNRTKRCNLCIMEKFYILYYPELATLNKRTELISCCRHSAKFLLKSEKLPDNG